MSDIWWVAKSGDAEDLEEALKKTGSDVNVTNEAGRTLAHVAADYNHVAILKFLKSKGANFNVKDKHGITPLLCAVWESHKGAVEYLLSVGADPNGTTPDGQKYVDAAESAEIKALFRR